MSREQRRCQVDGEFCWFPVACVRDRECRRHGRALISDSTLAAEVAMAAGALVYLSEQPERWQGFIDAMANPVTLAMLGPPPSSLLDMTSGRRAAVDLLGLSLGLIMDAPEPGG